MRRIPTLLTWAHGVARTAWHGAPRGRKSRRHFTAVHLARMCHVRPSHVACRAAEALQPCNVELGAVDAREEMLGLALGPVYGVAMGCAIGRGRGGRVSSTIWDTAVVEDPQGQLIAT